MKVSHKDRFDRKNLKTIRCQRYWSKFSLGEGIKFHDFHFSFGRERNRGKRCYKNPVDTFLSKFSPVDRKIDRFSVGFSFLFSDKMKRN